MVNDNAYKADLPDEYNVLATFNVKDLSLYLEDVDDSDLRTNHFQTEGDDIHHDSNMERADSNLYGYSDGPITRARAKQLQSALTSQISANEASMMCIMGIIIHFVKLNLICKRIQMIQ
jgi:hypothetical protein